LLIALHRSALKNLEGEVKKELANEKDLGCLQKRTRH
jgi:hypothetical protein